MHRYCRRPPCLLPQRGSLWQGRKPHRRPQTHCLHRAQRRWARPRWSRGWWKCQWLQRAWSRWTGQWPRSHSRTQCGTPAFRRFAGPGGHRAHKGRSSAGESTGRTPCPRCRPQCGWGPAAAGSGSPRPWPLQFPRAGRSYHRSGGDTHR